MGKAVGSPNGSDRTQEGRSEADESGQKRSWEGWRRWRGHQDGREGERWEGERRGLSNVILQLAAQRSISGAMKEDMWDRFSDGVGRSSAVGAVGVGCRHLRCFGESVQYNTRPSSAEQKTSTSDLLMVLVG
jgi:hypothetical protein